MTATATVARPKGLNCSSCGAGLEIRGFAHTLTVVCPACHAVLDAKDPNLRVLQEFSKRSQVYKPLIPLGTRGKVAGAVFEVIGFQVRGLESDGVLYTWSEYVLFNPYKGFRYITEYNGHWNVVRTLNSLPSGGSFATSPMKYGVDNFKHFQTAEARTLFVLGEFPWQVRLGEQVEATDYIAPPRMLSSETTPDEVTWSLGEYTEGRQIWQMFSLPGHPPPAQGVYANQPSPYKGAARHWLLFLALQAGLLVFFGLIAATQRNETVFQQKYSYASSSADSSFVTPVFDLKGRASNVDLEVNTDLDNQWAYLSFALINDATGQGYDFGREVSYYHGTDSDGSWSEGSAKDSVTIPSVPPGRYYLRVEPEMEEPTAASRPTMRYELIVKRDVPNGIFYLFAFLLLFVPPILATFRRGHFEKARWAESDHAG